MRCQGTDDCRLGSTTCFPNRLPHLFFDILIQRWGALACLQNVLVDKVLNVLRYFFPVVVVDDIMQFLYPTVSGVRNAGSVTPRHRAPWLLAVPVSQGH